MKNERYKNLFSIHYDFIDWNCFHSNTLFTFLLFSLSLSLQSAIQMDGFRSLGDEEEVEFECKPSDKGLEATLVTGIEGLTCKGSHRRPLSKKKFKKIRWELRDIREIFRDNRYIFDFTFILSPEHTCRPWVENSGGGWGRKEWRAAGQQKSQMTVNQDDKERDTEQWKKRDMDKEKNSLSLLQLLQSLN